MRTPPRARLAFPPPDTGPVVVNDRVSYRTEGTERVISVHGVVFAHYDTQDRAAEAYAMVTLVDAGYADQNDVASAFGYSTRSLRRYQARVEATGMAGLVRPPGRPRGRGAPSARSSGRAHTMLRLKTTGLSNRAIAGRLGVDEKVVRRNLRRLGWQPSAPVGLPFPGAGTPSAPPARDAAPGRPVPSRAAVAERPADPAGDLAPAPVPRTVDRDPLNRSMDRLLAAMGLLEDAAPLFARAARVPRAGVLLAIPSLVSSGLLGIAAQVYGHIGPAFYGLRTTLVAYVLLALLRIPRAEMLKEYAPVDLGRIVGLDRVPEVKTLRRKVARLAAGSQALGRALAERRVRERGRGMGFLYLDGHVRAYHGKRTLPKAYLTRSRLAVPATTDYWVNDRRGDPVFVVTADANAAMTRMLEPTLTQVRTLIGPQRRVTIVFDRGGWSPSLFTRLLALGFDLLTYRKGRVRQVAEKRFVWRTARLDARRVRYHLHDQAVRFLRGTLRLRQVTRLREGHQTPVELIRPHYARVDEEGRTLIQTALQSTAAIDPTDHELRITLAPLSSPHRTRAVAALCETLNARKALFPGTTLQMRFVVADA